MNRSQFELLLPVGQKEMAEAAIQNGADAIYIGFPGFNARGRSYDFELAELKHIIEICHLNGVKVNLAFNILIFETELNKVVEAIKAVLPLKPDALIIQDLGLVKLVREICPKQVIHASTQMSVTNDLAISFLQDLKIQRFVLGRENSLSEIELIASRNSAELEVFVHGALCVSYSGQCFTSETLGGRSANRGQCAQSCRFSYDLIVDGEVKNLVDRTYLVSPQDLCGLNEIPQLMKLGVKSFKVEGRLKSPEYVAQVAKSYRNAIDKTISNNGLGLTVNESSKEKQKMAIEYSRGFFSGWLHGVDHQKLVDGTFGSHRGLFIGQIAELADSSVIVELDPEFQLALENGDGVSWFENGERKGASIFNVSRLSSNRFKIEFSNSLRINELMLHSKLYLNHDKSQKLEIEKSLRDREAKRRTALRVNVKVSLNEPLFVQITDGRFVVSGRTDSPMVLAQNKPLSIESLYEEFSSLSASVFSLDKNQLIVEGLNSNEKLFVYPKEIKLLRQFLINQLETLRKQNRVNSDENFELKESFQIVNREPIATNSIPKINILLRSKDQVDELINAINIGKITKTEISSVTLDFEFGRNYKTSVEALKFIGVQVGIATTRILKPQEYNNLKIIHQLNPDFVLVRNLGAAEYFQKVNPFSGLLKGDFSLNVSNSLTFNYLLERGLSSVCLSYDLNGDQTNALLSQVNSSKAEIVIHQSMPSFHMEHCVFAAFLSKGSSFRDCGKPCEKHRVQLKDQFGNYHWIKPDQECRNTMFNASAQTGLSYLDSWKQSGLGEIRIEMLDESSSDLIEKISCYTDVIQNRIALEEALNKLRVMERYGLAPNQLSRSIEYQSRKKNHSFLISQSEN